MQTFKQFVNESGIIPFKLRTFYLCYDCGWGEKGITEYECSYDHMFDIITRTYDTEKAEWWAEQEDGHVEIGNDTYVLDNFNFEEEDWEGSDDW
jgi:hypothetical protein